MASKTTLAEVGKCPGTAKELAARLNMEETSVSSELLTLYGRGKVTRTKVPNEKGRPVYQYRIADEAASQA